jgi:hypothetical protein
MVALRRHSFFLKQKTSQYKNSLHLTRQNIPELDFKVTCLFFNESSFFNEQAVR